MKNNYFFKKQFSNIYKKASKNSEVTSQILYGEEFNIYQEIKNGLKLDHCLITILDILKIKIIHQNIIQNIKCIL